MAAPTGSSNLLSSFSYPDAYATGPTLVQAGAIAVAAGLSADLPNLFIVGYPAG